jgi:hypothetical protein
MQHHVDITGIRGDRLQKSSTSWLSNSPIFSVGVSIRPDVRPLRSMATVTSVFHQRREVSVAMNTLFVTRAGRNDWPRRMPTCSTVVLVDVIAVAATCSREPWRANNSDM